MAFCKQSLRGVSRGDFTFQQPLVQRVLLPARNMPHFPNFAAGKGRVCTHLAAASLPAKKTFPGSRKIICKNLSETLDK